MASRKITAISAIAAMVAALSAGPAVAEQERGAGYVSNLSGPLFALKADGSRRVLSVQSAVDSGDTLVTEDKTYARVRFTDQSEVTLRPSSQLQIENYAFDRQAPDRDNSAFRLIKGALRTVTGLIGRRGNQDAYRVSTATATIGIRGTIYGVTVCAPGTCGSLPAGTYVNVIDGRVGIAPPVTPSLPTPPPPLVLSAGQFGYVAPSGAVSQLPSDPGVGRFSPPASFVQRQDAPPPAQQQPGEPAKPPVLRPSSGVCDVR